MLRWNEEITCKFVKIYLSHECLWNRNHDDYKVRNIRALASKEVIKAFKESTGIALSEPELSLKLKSLRSTYSQELTKIKQRSTSNWTYKPSLKWFSHWDRCIRKVEENLGFTLLEDAATESNQENSHEKIWLSNNIEDNTTSSDAFDSDYSILLKVEPEDGVHLKKSQNTSISKENKRIQRSLSADSSYNFSGSIDSRTDCIEDEFDIYGKYIASQLRKMDMQRALKLQLEIQSLVSAARIAGIEASN